MHWIDWSILWIFIAFITIMAYGTKKYTKSVADFIAGNRCAGRYMLGVAQGMAGLGAISVIACFEIYYKAGFSASWWQLLLGPVWLFMSLSGWVLYRFRQTRALTMSQFFEVRYSKKFRIFTGILSFLSGIINFGIFPAVGSRFFIYFCGLPTSFEMFGITLSTFVILMISLLTISVFFALLGGQIAVMITDFLQGTFCNITFVIVIMVLLYKFGWSHIVEGISMTSEGKSMIHPFQGEKIKDFNIWYFAIAAFGALYCQLAWQGTLGYNCSAKNAHEAKMGSIVGSWRGIVQSLVLLLIPICAYVVMHHPNYSLIAENANVILGTIENSEIKEQMTVPVILRHILPVGVVGAFCAAMFAAFVSNHETYLHSWGSILIQDVILPFRAKPFTTKQHLWLLRFSIIAVAVFIFFFSLIFRQTENIVMFMAITGTIWLGGAGSVIIGGLYWKSGTTAAAWCSLILGSIMAILSMVVKQIPAFAISENLTPILALFLNFFNILKETNGQVLFFYTMLSSIITYVFVSLLTNREPFNLDRMLHRGKYAIDEDFTKKIQLPAKGWKSLGMGEEFTRGDRIIYISLTSWSLGWMIVFLIGNIYNLTHDVKAESWFLYWQILIWICFVVGAATVIWLSIGGILDMISMFRALRTIKRNVLDDGMVINHQNLDENVKSNLDDGTVMNHQNLDKASTGTS